VIDFLLGAALALMVLRGWVRGLVREVLDLAGLVLGAAIAFRLSIPVGDFLSDRFGFTSEWARIGAGVALLLGLGVGLAIVARVAGRMMRLPGLGLLNRFGGSAVALGWGVLVAAIVLTIVAALPLPAVHRQLAESQVARMIAGPGALPVRFLATVGGEKVASAVALLRSLAGDRRLVVEGEERIELEPVAPTQVAASPAAAEELYSLLTASRLEAKADPLAWSDELAAVARSHALEMYELGYLSHTSSEGGLPQRLGQVRLARAEEAIALAATTRAVHRALLDSGPNRATLLATWPDRVGIGVVAGPFGLVVVEIFGG
jgi:membrane protein required for colicin V production